MARPTALPARIAQASEANTYFVSLTGNDTTGDGSIGNPYRTAKKAHDVASLTASLILIRGGTYTDTNFAYFRDRNFTAGNGLTVRAYADEVVTISPSAANAVGITTMNAANIRVQGPRILVNDCASDGLRVEAYTANCTNIEFYGLEVGRAGSHASSSSGQGLLVAATGAGFKTTNVQCIGCKIYSPGFAWPGANNLIHGMYLGSTSDTNPGLELGAFYNNLIYDCAKGYGIQLYNKTDRSVIANNTIDNCLQSGITVAGEGAVSSLENEISNNIISNCGRYGIEYYSLLVSAGNVFHHNCLYNNAFGASATISGRLDDTGNNITTDPLFANRTGKDFMISTASPSRNVSDLTFAPTIDYAGSPR